MMSKQRRVIVTKRRTYRLADDAQGIPVEDYFPNAKLPETIKGAIVYQTKDGPVIAYSVKKRKGLSACARYRIY